MRVLLRPALALSVILLAVCTCRSYFVVHNLHAGQVSVVLARGSFFFIYDTHRPPLRGHAAMAPVSWEDAWHNFSRSARSGVSFWGFAFLQCRGEFPERVVGFPLWLPLSVLVLLTGRSTLREVTRSRRRSEGRCLSCGYPLLGSSTRCPECGEPTVPARKPDPHRTPA